MAARNSARRRLCSEGKSEDKVLFNKTLIFLQYDYQTGLVVAAVKVPTLQTQLQIPIVSDPDCKVKDAC